MSDGLLALFLPFAFVGFIVFVVSVFSDACFIILNWFKRRELEPKL